MTSLRKYLFVMLLGIFAGYGIATAQLSAMDPVRVAPHIYENVLENDKVRVLKVTDRNGETPPIHSHPDRVAVFLSPCAWMEQDTDGTDRMQSYRLGDVLWLQRETHGGVTSGVIQDCSIIEVELK